MAVDAASGRMDDIVIPWLREVERDDVEFSTLRHPTEPSLVSLDKKLAQALPTICHGEFKRKLLQAEEEQMASYSTTLRGRQILWPICQALSLA